MSIPSSAEIVVVGAGVAGLACARVLQAAGRDVVVLERARGVGGRCATRRVEGQPTDHGVGFLHGSHPAFLAALAEVPAERLRWPQTYVGSGTPCQPTSFAPGHERWAFRDGQSVFPKYLAQGVRVFLETTVTGLLADEDAIGVTVGHLSVRARGVVLCLPLEQVRGLLAPLGPIHREVRAAEVLLGMLGSVPCLTLIAGYPIEGPRPDWQICYPDSPVLQTVSHDSTKRSAPRWTTLVLQCQVAWSKRHLDGDTVDGWSAEVLREAGRVVGPWASAPAWAVPQPWRYARVDRGTELASPLLLALVGGGLVGLGGEGFAPGGGVEAAYLSGQRLAGRLLESGRF